LIAKAATRYPVLTLLLTILSGYGTGLCQDVIVSHPVVNVRSGPGTGYEIVARVKQGDRFPVLKVKGLWVQVEIGKETLERVRIHKTKGGVDSGVSETWIFRNLLKFVGKPPDFEERQIEFQNWALDEIPVTYIEFKSDWQIWVRLPPDKYASKERVRRIARKMAQEYKKQTGFMERKVVVKVLKRDRIYATASD